MRRLFQKVNVFLDRSSWLSRTVIYSASGVSSRRTLTHARTKKLQQVLERANRVVKQVAESEKYDAIFQEAVYINPKHDITDKVIKALNAGTGK
jgi:Skp family chaperone for outer membrane proteins